MGDPDDLLDEARDVLADMKRDLEGLNVQWQRERVAQDMLNLWRRVKSSQSAQRALVAMTRAMDEHPEGWDGPCECSLCMSYGD